jgi:hypothetical protein
VFGLTLEFRSIVVSETTVYETHTSLDSRVSTFSVSIEFLEKPN